MRLLIDESLPRDLVGHLRDHDVSTVQQMGWSGVKNGDLLQRARDSGFDALITADRGFEHQQNLNRLPIGILLTRSPSNRLKDLVPLVPEVLSKLRDMKPGEFIKVQF